MTAQKAIWKELLVIGQRMMTEAHVAAVGPATSRRWLAQWECARGEDYTHSNLRGSRVPGLTQRISMGGPMVDLERHMISFVNLQVAMHKVALAVVLIDSTSGIDIANRICLKKNQSQFRN